MLNPNVEQILSYILYLFLQSSYKFKYIKI